VIFHPSHRENKNVELLANTCGVSPHSGSKFIRHEFAAIFGAEYYVDYVLRVRMGHVSRLRRLATLYTTYPALTRWANLCRASGARMASYGEVQPATNERFWRDLCYRGTEKSGQGP